MATQTETKSPFMLLADIKKQYNTIDALTSTDEQWNHKEQLFGAMNICWYLISGDDKEWQNFLKGEER